MLSDWAARFLRPQFAVCDAPELDWQGLGAADTPGEDARCRIWLHLDEPTQYLIARFAAFGPPVVIAAADWVCETIDHTTVGQARQLAALQVERALALLPTQRYAALLATDALANALANLGI
ncbi:MAG: iron-sulfur cluster assembly scaffold protein [Salinisphaera sp.]|jgi:NifU-like protein involved in Fe-S cluster formation|nr:iron-sulfur cluster assembly scaffold protein [Salinisphaera sp.]